MSNSLQQTGRQAPQAQVANKPKFSVAINTKQFQNAIHNTLGDPDRCKRFVASITSAVAVNPALQDCDAGTILAGALLGESLNLSPSPQLGQYYLVPFECRVKDADGKVVWQRDENGNIMKGPNGKWLAVTEKKANFVLGYKGFVQMALRSGYYAGLDVMEIKAGEYLGKDPTTGEPTFRFIEDDDERDELPVIGYMAWFKYLNGFKKVIYWSKKKMMTHADTFSPAFSAEAYQKVQAGEVADKDMWKYSSFWYKNFDDMAKKTLLRQLISKWGVMSTDLQKAYESDATFSVDDALDIQDDTMLEAPVQIPTMEEPAIHQPPADEVEKIDISAL